MCVTVQNNTNAHITEKIQRGAGVHYKTELSLFRRLIQSLQTEVPYLQWIVVSDRQNYVTIGAQGRPIETAEERSNFIYLIRADIAPTLGIPPLSSTGIQTHNHKAAFPPPRNPDHCRQPVIDMANMRLDGGKKTTKFGFGFGFGRRERELSYSYRLA